MRFCMLLLHPLTRRRSLTFCIFLRVDKNLKKDLRSMEKGYIFALRKTNEECLIL